MLLIDFLGARFASAADPNISLILPNFVSKSRKSRWSDDLVENRHCDFGFFDLAISNQIWTKPTHRHLLWWLVAETGHILPLHEMHLIKKPNRNKNPQFLRSLSLERIVMWYQCISSHLMVWEAPPGPPIERHKLNRKWSEFPQYFEMQSSGSSGRCRGNMKEHYR